MMKRMVLMMSHLLMGRMHIFGKLLQPDCSNLWVVQECTKQKNEIQFKKKMIGVVKKQKFGKFFTKIDLTLTGEIPVG